ncbi:MAG: N-6 DNA methylase [Candidatus Lokiarchaeota archaeon]|nr:N-6 DNA methylase [Candidatus Lokiarchaeota archaeon]
MAGTVSQRCKGVYYTPDFIARLLCKESIARYLSRQLSISMVDAETFLSGNPLGELKARACQVDLLLKNITIVDPAAGQGIMLVSMLEEIARARVHVLQAMGLAPEDGQLYHEVATRSLFGIDVDAEAILIARNSIASTVVNSGHFIARDDATIIESHVTIGNSLADLHAGVMQGAFDIVISNPPYVSYYGNAPTRLIDTERNILQQSFELVDRLNQRINSMNLFIELGIKLLKDGGVLAYIVNKTLCVLPSYQKTRAFLLARIKIHKIVIDLNPFDDAIVDTALLWITRDAPPPDYHLSWCSMRGIPLDRGLLPATISDHQVTISITNFKKHKHLEFTYSVYEPILEKMERARRKMSEILTLHRGINIGGCSEHFLSPTPLDGRYRMVIRDAKNIQHYRAWWNDDQGFLVFDQAKERALRAAGKTLVLGDPARYEGPRLFVPEAGNAIRAAYIDVPLYSAYGILVGKPVHGEDDLKIACAMLNSRAITFYAIEREILRKGNKATPHAGVKGLAGLPVPAFDSLTRKELVSHVDALLDRHVFTIAPKKYIPFTREDFDLMERIDRVIFESFGLDAVDVQSINEAIGSLFK